MDQGCHPDHGMLASDRGGDRRGDDGNAGSGADPHTHGNGDLAEAEASRRQSDQAAAERENGDDLAPDP
ncbi:hypothetical protein GCM10020258_51220 [Sphingomonas yabuuchiae]